MRKRKIKKFLLEPKVLLLLLSLILSLCAIFYTPNLFSSEGVEITRVSGEPCIYSKIQPPYFLEKVCLNERNCIAIRSLDDLFAFKNKTGWLTLYTDKGKETFLYEGEGMNCSFDYKMPKKTNLNFGLDLVGGIRAIIFLENQSNNTLQRVVSILETRINTFGLKEAKFRVINTGEKPGILITIAGGGEKDLLTLLNKTGVFEAGIKFELKDGDEFVLCKHTLGKEKRFKVFIINNSWVKIGDRLVGINQRSELCKVPFEVRNITENKAEIEFFVYSGEDIKAINYAPEVTQFYCTQKGCRYQFGVITSIEGAKKFADVTENLERVQSPSGECYLSSKINFYLDRKLIDSLNIGCSLKGKELTTPVIQGYGKDREEALKSERTLQAVLKSGALPTKIFIESIERIDPKVGLGYLQKAFLAGLLAILLVSLLVYIRYRNPLISLGIIGTMLSEVIIILGFAAITRWTLSISALAGIIAAIGFGVDDQIIIVDESLYQKRKEEKVYSLFHALKIAFFMIFASAATTIAAMLPLLFLGFSVYKELTGFALTTIVGVLIGVLITRPAFGKYVEYVVKG